MFACFLECARSHVTNAVCRVLVSVPTVSSLERVGCTGTGSATLTLCSTPSATLTVTGTSFGPAGTAGTPVVTVDGVTCTSASVTADTTLTCTLASTGAAAQVVTVTVGSQPSLETGVTLGFAGQCLCCLFAGLRLLRSLPRAHLS
jgi:hypothetical protein